MKWTLGVLLVAVCGFAQAADTKPQRPQTTCDKLAAAFESGVKELSFIRSEGVPDNSAARETNRQLEKVVTTNIMQMHLTLMQANKCTLPTANISDVDYYIDALSCTTAMLKAPPGEKEMPPECDRSKWTRMFDEKK
jgi:hypothetical protein